MPVGANAGIAGLNVNVGVNLQQFDAGMRQVEQRGAQAASSLNNVGSALTTGAGIGAGFAVATAALSALSGVAAAAGSAIVGLNSDLEQARIGFTAFTGSAEKANAFVKQLQDFAAKTTFEFPGLLQAARQLTGMGVQAELVIPILKDVGTAVMRVGGNDASITAVNRALVQMMATGKVMAGDMNQLAQAGLPAWKMLADSMGMTIGQVRKLSEEGKISADQMLEAFHRFANENGMDELLTKSSQTWQAATSNIIDGLRNIGAEGFEPLFNAMRDVAVQFANMLTQGDGPANFAADLKATIQDLVNSAAPLGDAFKRAFEAFKSDGVSGAISSILTDVQNLASQMGGAGVQLISEFAGGIMSGGASLITEAANFIADIIASFLIGNSPPPVGPLSQIAQGGANVIAAYVEGMKGGTTEISDVAQSIVDAFGNVDGAMTLSAGRQALQAAGTDMKALAEAAEGAEGVLRGLDSQIRDNQSQLRDYQNAAIDIKDAYESAIDPLRQQVDALKEATDLSQKQADIQSRIALAQLKGALQQAQGDPVVRAKLQTQLDTLEQQEKELTLQERALSLQNQSAALAAKARGEKVSDTAGATAVNALAQRRLALQQQQNSIQQQLNGMVDKEAVARIKSQQAQVQAVKDTRDINNEVADLNRQLQAAPLEAQIKELQSQQEALLRPIQERVKETQREGQALQEQRKDWQDIKSAITDVMQTQKAAAAQSKADGVAASKAAKEAALTRTTDLTRIFKPEAITESAAKVGESWLKGFNSYMSQHAASIIGASLGALLGGAAFGPFGAIAGGLFGKAFMERMQANFGSLENFGGSLAAKLSDALNIDTSGATNSVEAFAIIFETMRDRALGALENLRSGIAEKLQGAQGVLAEWQTKWQSLFGTDSAGAQSGIAAIDGINKALQALQLLMSGDVQGAVSTLKESFAQFGVAGSLGIEQLTTSFTDLKVALEPLVPVVAGIAAAFVAFRVLTTVIAAVTAFAAAWTAVTAVVAPIVSVIGMAWASIAGGAAILETIGAAAALLGLSITGVGLIIAAVVAVIGVFTAAWVGNWGNIQGITASAIEAITTGFASFTTMLTDGATALWEMLTGAWTAGTQAIADLQTAMWNLLTPENQQNILALQALFTELWTLIQELWTAGTTAVLATATTWWASLVTGTQTLWTDIQTYWDSGLTGIQEAIAPAYLAITGATTTLFTTLSGLWEGAKSILGPIATDLGTYIMTSLTTALNAAVDTVVGAVTGAVRRAIEAAKGLLTSWTGSMSSGGAAGLMSFRGNASGGKADPGMAALLNEMAAKYKLDARLFMAQMQHESAGFDPNVTSGKRKGVSGELGIGQFMPGTLTTMLQRNGLTLEQYLGNAKVQVELAAQHMSELVTTFGDYDKALQAYNGGSGGVGSAATQRYAAIVKDVAATLKTEGTGGTEAASAIKMNMGISQIRAATEGGLSAAEAATFCGPYAAMLFAQATGRNPTAAEAKELAVASGWNARDGMGGTGNFMSMLGRMGIDAVRQAATPGNVNAALGSGRPVAFSTPNHYFVGSGGTAAGGINVGATGTVMPGGKGVMTLAEITQVGGGMQDLIVLTGKLQASGEQTFNNLTRVTGQFGDALRTEVTTLEGDLATVGATGAAANAQLTTSTNTLAQSIQSGVVPAGLAARNAVGQMAIGIQPLIAAWANGQLSSDQMAESIVQLAAQTGLASEPLTRFAAGNSTLNNALHDVMSALAAADPAFAQIEQSILGTQVSTEQLADTMVRGLANVTGNVGASMTQAATAVVPLQEAFTSGAISGEQFVASVVELAATSGLTQAPLRMMQDGVISANEALGQVVEAAGQATPSLLGMTTAFGDLPAPATDAANAFLEWIKSLQETEAATVTTTDAIATVPEAVTGLQAPMQDAAVTAMQTLPEATTEALNATVEAIRGISESAASAAAEVGQAIVDSLKSTVEAAAEDIAETARNIVEKALEAAKKAAEEVKKSVGKSDGKGDDTDKKARGGRLNAGVWTLVGEEGPELISPSGYVHTASETTDMLMQGINSGLFTLNKFAKGGQTSKGKGSKSKDKGGKEGSSGSSTPQKQNTPMYKEELDLQEQILGINLKRDTILSEMAPHEEKLNAALREQEKASKGTLNQRLNMAENDERIAVVQNQIARLMFSEEGGYNRMIDYQNNLADLKLAQSEASKGDRNHRMELIRLDGLRLEGEQKIAQIQADSAGIRGQLANAQADYDHMVKGSLQDQLKVADLTGQQHVNQLAINNLQQKSAPLQQQVVDLQSEIDDIMKGTAEQQIIMAGNAREMLEIDAKTAVEQGKLLPIQANISKLQRTIASIEKGSLDGQRVSIEREAQKNKLSIEQVGIQTQISAVQKQISDIEKGTLATQYAAIDAEVQKAQLSLNDIALQTQVSVLEREISDIEKGSLATQFAAIDAQTRKAKLGINEIGIQSRVSALQKQISDIEKGSLADQYASVDAQKKAAQLRLQEIDIQGRLRAVAAGTLVLSQDQINALHRQLEVIGAQKSDLQDQNEIKQLQAQITNTDAQKQLLALQAQSEANQAIVATLDEQSQIKALQAQIDTADAQKQMLSLQDQLSANQSIKDNLDQQSQISQLQATINTADAQKSLLSLEEQNAANQRIQDSLSQQSQISQLQATLNSVAARLQLASLQESESQHQAIIEDMAAQRAVLENQTAQINTQNAVSAAGQQARINELNLQIGVYQRQAQQLQAQNSVIDLQVAGIQLANQLRADALQREIISLMHQVSVYDLQIEKIGTLNGQIAAQAALITANNAVAAQGYAVQIADLEQIIAHRDLELGRLQRQKEYLEGQNTVISTGIAVSAAGHAAQIIALAEQVSKQSDVVFLLNAQLGTLNAQKRVYEDIRALADAIANRPPNPTPVPPPNAPPPSGPPGTVAATATKDGQPTLYLSRGTGTDGWYTSDGRLQVQGANSSPPSGYRVRWLAEGGLWRAGEMAVVGEEGPELVIAARDMHVFPHEKSSAIARAFGRASTYSGDSGSDSTGKSVTVNVEYHRHSGNDYGEGTLVQVVREAVNVALRS